jgi:4-diphosphocytidyl-2-C-methyl-D-erythritol kinase
VTAGDPRSLTLSAPAKVNLGLRIVGRRADGYHLIESLFVPIDLCDELTLEVRELAGGEPTRLEFELLESSGAGLPSTAPADAENLAARAAREFALASGLSLAIGIRLRKRIPVGAGLGGGSSDAGAVLRGLTRLHPDALSEDQVHSIALGLGADVPFFLDPRPATVSGIGERVEPAAGVPELALVLANPGVSLATAAVYAEYDRLAGALTAPRSRSTLPPLAGPDKDAGSSECFARRLGDGRLQNDLEAAAVRLCPEIRSVGDGLEAVGALAVGMSGSGATSFGVFPDHESARTALSEAAFEPGVWARVAATAGAR